MRDDACTIVKVGGSLYDLPDLRQRLRDFMTSLRSPRVVLVPGGGAPADAVRQFDRVHRLGEETSHWLAIQALSLNARWLHALLPEARRVDQVPLACAAGLYVVDALPFFQADEARPDHLPHHWQVTSDSLAVRVATLMGATELILLKSIDWADVDWTTARNAEIVDRYFVEALRQMPAELRVRIVNLRTFS